MSDDRPPVRFLMRVYVRAIVFLVILGLLAGFALGVSVASDLWLSPVTGLLLCLGVLVLLATFVVGVYENERAHGR